MVDVREQNDAYTFTDTILHRQVCLFANVKMQSNQTKPYCLEHEWTILNFNLDAPEKLRSVIYSKKFPPNSQDFQFYLRLVPNLDENETNSDSHLSVFLYLDSCKIDSKLKAKYYIEIFNKIGVKRVRVHDGM